MSVLVNELQILCNLKNNISITFDRIWKNDSKPYMESKGPTTDKTTLRKRSKEGFTLPGFRT